MRPHPSLIAILVALTVGLSLAGAQGAEPVHRIGYLSHGPSPALEALQDALRTLGWIEGQNVIVEYRLTGGKDERIPELAADLVRLRVDLIVAAGSNYADAALRATRTIPIVFCTHGDPVGAGHVASLSRPGGNVTGISNLLTELSAKQLELLNAAVPGPGPIAVLWNPATPTHAAALPAVKAAARDLGIEIRLVPAKVVEEFAAAFNTMGAEHVRAALALVSPSYYVHHARLAELAFQYRLPTMLGWSEFPKAGGLMSYGPNLNEMFGHCAGLVDKLLRGAKPAEVPVEQASTYQLVVNLKAAQRLDLALPAAILSRADEVIE
jgi:putative ABC transport system substrate-binding protein